MICIPVVAATNEAVMKQMDKCFPLADVVELRIDFIGNVNLRKLLYRENRQDTCNSARERRRGTLRR